MSSLGDRFNQITGKTRFVVFRLFLHLAGKEVAPLLGVLNSSTRQALEVDGELEVFGAGLGEICQSLLQYDVYWQSAANEGNIFWDEGEAGDFVEELFTDSAQRYRSGVEIENLEDSDELLSLPITQNLIVMLVVAYEGEIPALETDLSDISALRNALKALANLPYQDRLRALQIHFSPAQLGDELTSDQLLLHYPELLPL